MDQLMFLRDYQYPMLTAASANRVAMLQKYGAESPERAREEEGDLFHTQNAAKAYNGYDAGLHAKKTRRQLRRKASRPMSTPWAEIN